MKNLKEFTNDIVTSLEDIKLALAEKGVTVEEPLTMSEVSHYIDQVSLEEDEES